MNIAPSRGEIRECILTILSGNYKDAETLSDAQRIDAEPVGFDSLDSLDFLARVSDSLGVEIPDVKRLSEFNTIGRLIDAFETAVAHRGNAPVISEGSMDRFLPQIGEQDASANRPRTCSSDTIEQIIENYEKVKPALERLALSYFVQVARTFGGVPFHSTIAPGVADRLSERVTTVVKLKNYPSSMQALPGQLEELEVAFPEYLPESRMIRLCGEALASVIAGERDGLEVLFPGGSIEPLRQFYSASPIARGYNRCLAEAVVNAIGRWPGNERMIRVLEVGAGTGATTIELLQRLDDKRLEYYYTDVSQRFVTEARKAYGHRQCLCFQALDVEEPAFTTQLSQGTFDVVIAANILHSTRSIAKSLRNLKCYLVRGGVLAVQETTRRELWHDLVFGLTAGWWRHLGTEERTDGPLLGRKEWQDLLVSEGFHILSTTPSGGSGFQTVLVAENTGSASL